MNDSTIRPGSAGPAGNNDSTIRPGSAGPAGNNSQTIRPGSAGPAGNNSSTIRPGSVGPAGNNSSTIRPGSAGPAGNTSQTLRGGSSTIRGGATPGGQPRRVARPAAGGNSFDDGKSSKGAIFSAKEFVLDGKKVHLVEYMPQMSGEAQLIKVEAKGKKYMMKLYFGNIHPNHDILDKVKSIPQGLPGLMRLYMHGIWTNPDDAADKRDYEVMELCEGGMLSEVDIKGNEEKWKKLAMQMACSIDLCHQRGFIHLDVKPENFLFVDKEKKNLVLGDFGLAVAHDAKGMGFAPQARTKKYAAPEIYRSIDGAPIEVSVKTDFYSLGMTLMRMWMGKDEFEKVIGSLSERQLMNMKNNGKVPLPTGLSDHSLSLIKALLRPDIDDRAGYDEVERWAKGENLCPETGTGAAVDEELSLVFNGAKKQVAHSFVELADFMMQDQSLAKKFLYSGKLSKLLENKYPELALDLDDITENWYPDNQDAGLLAAVFTIDDSKPLYDVQGKPCNNFAEIAHSLLYNFDRYLTDLKDATHPFYIYLRVNDAGDWADSIHKQLVKSADDSLLRFIYYYNAKLPYRIVTDDKKIFYPGTIDDVLAYAEKLSDDTKWEITSSGFTKWLYTRNTMIAGEVEAYLKKNSWETKCWPGVLYRLNKNCGYNFRIVTANSTNAQFTPKQLAERLNRLLNDHGRDSQKYVFFQDFMLMDGRLLEYYLDARGFTKQKDYIKYCFNINSSVNTKKPGPYNEIIAAYKCIAALGATPTYKTQSGTLLKTLADVDRLPVATRKSEIHTGTLREFLAVLFQENPSLNLSKKYTYELETEKYLKYIAKTDSDEYHVRRFNDAVEKTETCVDKVKNLRSSVVLMRVLVAVLALLPLAGFALYFIFAGLPFTHSPLTPFNSTVFGIICIISVLAWFGLTDGAGSCIGEIFWGVLTALAVYWGLHFILKLILPLSGYIIGGLLAIYAWFIARSTIFGVKLGTSSATLGTDELVVAPLHFAYRSSQSITAFTPTVALTTQSEENYLSSNIKSARNKTIWAVITSLLLAALLWFLNGGTFGGVTDTSTAAVEQTLAGSWNGEFLGKPATLVIGSIGTDDSKKVEATMYVKFKRLAKEEVKGVWENGAELTLTLEDVNTNGILDGVYAITVDTEGTMMTCRYTNKTSGKVVDFTLRKEGGNTSVTSSPASSSSSSSSSTSSAKTSSNQPSTSSDYPSAAEGKSSSPTSSGHSAQSGSTSTSSESNSTARTETRDKPASSGSGSSKVNETDGSRSSGGFRLEEVNDKTSSGGGFKLENIN